MHTFKVGDLVRRVHTNKVSTFQELKAGVTFRVVSIDDEFVRGPTASHFPKWLEPVVEGPTSPTLAQPTARAALKSVLSARKLKFDVLRAISNAGPDGLNGHEIAVKLGSIGLLNSVTPRLAPLRREGFIKDSGQRRERQIVWVVA